MIDSLQKYADAYLIHYAEMAAAANAAGKVLALGGQNLVLADPHPAPPPTPQERIWQLEAQQTARRVRGASIGNAEDLEFLQALEAQIAEIRAEMAAAPGAGGSGDVVVVPAEQG
ncbi:hypothetical protein FACS1894186_4250 [Alphaproteobacteria bacterium]|nr:hypothetical protein FACS1894186_4250 [Alphaproteobacteria bacterium]